jgi:hypothetical protein
VRLSNFLGVIWEQSLPLLVPWIYDLNDLLNRAVNTFDADPAECGLAVGWHMRFFDESDRLEHIGDVIQTPDFGFKHFFINLFIWDLPGCLLERDHRLPADKEVDKLLAETSEWLDFFVLWLSLAPLAESSVFIVGGNLDNLVAAAIFRELLNHRLI